MTHPLPPDVLETVRAALAAHYEVRRILGSGAMGSVLLAHDRTLDRAVAVKVINPDLAATSSFRQRFLQEARTIAKLRHQGIVGVHSAGEASGVLYFVMEFVEGESLRELMEREGRLPAARASAILRELGEALSYAHGAGVIHRDIKPENILIESATGHARLTDFGIARSLSAAGERVTGTGMTVGTPAYMSPEQASGERDIDGRSDLYSLGLVGYEMLAGAPPFTGRSGSVILKQITEEPAPVIDQAPDAPPTLAAVIHRALAKDPDHRWPDGRSIVRAIDEAMAAPGSGSFQRHAEAAPGVSTPTARHGIDTGATPSGASSAHHRSLRRAPAVLAVLALAVIAPLLWFFTGRSSGVPDDVDPRKSFLVVPFRVQGADQSLAWLRDGSVSMLALNLAQWRDISVVEYERSLDLLRDAGVEEGTAIGLSQARELARRAGVWTVVMGDITRTGDSLTATARMYAVESGEQVGRGTEARMSGSADPRSLFDALANGLLGVVGAPAMELALAKTTTGSLEAYRHYLAGVRALNEWRLDAADSALGAAVAVDSTFALAWYKRSLATGWRRSSDTATMSHARKAMTFASRLPSRERTLVEGNFEQQQRNYGAAQQRYRALLATDSTDAEAWYGLADAYYHDPTPERRAQNLTASLAAFDRTLQLDSTFHLAYSHRVDLYSEASRDGAPVIIERDTVRMVAPGDGPALSLARIDSARRSARELAVRNAEQWVHTDEDAAPAYFALAEAHATTRDFARAVQTLERAMARPTTRMADFPYRIASYQLGAGSPDALASLRRALREQTGDSLRARAGARRFQTVLAAANVALAAGAIRELDSVFARIREGDPHVPGSERTGTPLPTETLLDPLRATISVAIGLEKPGTAAHLAALARQLERLPGPAGDAVRREAVSLTQAGFMLTRDTTYLAMMRRWGGTGLPAAFRALAALEAGDTATAARIAEGFRRTDSSAVRRSSLAMGQAIFESDVLARLGELRGALRLLELVDPTNFPVLHFDPVWGVYPSILLDRASLHERLGEPERADSLYTRVIDVWKQADAEGQPLVDLARKRLAALRDAPRSVRVPRD